MLRLFVFLVSLGTRALRALCQRRADLMQDLALRQQVTPLKKERPRPPIDDVDLVHFNATFNPTAGWVMQQLREAFPFDDAPRFLIFDRDSNFSPAVERFVRALGIDPVRTSYRSPWQNGTAERWIGNCRRELLEHVVVFGARHFVRLVRLYISYYHEDRCHLGLDKDTPDGRPVSR